MNKLTSAAFAAALAVVAARSVAAEPLQGDHAPIGGALAAKIIGETCPDVMSSAEVSELGRYVDRLVAIEKAKGEENKAFMERFVPELTADYRSDRLCGIGDTELAKDMLLRVRRETGSIH
jgi:hypothetical protein